MVGLEGEVDLLTRRELFEMVDLDADLVSDLFTAASIINPDPDNRSAERAERHFGNFLTSSFPDARLVWAERHRWRSVPHALASRTPIRVG